jgi:hypothetical protein
MTDTESDKKICKTCGNWGRAGGFDEPHHPACPENKHQFWAILYMQEKDELTQLPSTLWANAWFADDVEGRPLLFHSLNAATEYKDALEIDGKIVEIPTY